MWAVVRFAGAVARRSHRRASVAVVLVIGLAATAIVSAVAVSGAADRELDRASERGGGADLVVTTDVETVDAITATLENRPEVAEVGTARIGLSAEMIADATNRIEHRITVVDEDTSEATGLGSPVITSGRLPAASDEIAVDAALAGNRDIEIGDSVRFDGASTESLEYQVVGLGYDFDDCFFPQCDPARSWMSAEAMARLGAAEFAVISVDLVEGTDPAALQRRLATTVEDGAVGTNSWLDTRTDMMATTEFLAGFLTVFGIFVLVAVGLVVATSIAGRAVQSRRELALMRAVGATPGQVTTALVAQQTVLAAAGGLVGWVASSLVTPLVAAGPLAVVGQHRPTPGLDALLLVTIGAMVIVAALTLIPAYRIARTPVAECLRDEPFQRRRGRTQRGCVTGWLRPEADVGTRSWLARPVRSLTAAAALAIAIVGGIVSLSIVRSMDHVLAHPELTGDPWDVAAERDDLDPRAARQLLTTTPEVGGWFAFVDGEADVEGAPVHVRTIDGDPTDAGFAIGEGRRLQSPGEAIAGYTLFTDNQWRIGQQITLTSPHGVSEVTLVGWYRETEDDGRVLTMSSPPAEPSPATTSIMTYAVSSAAGVDPLQLASALSESGWVTRINEADPATTRPFRRALLAMAAVLAAVAVAHIAATALATARSRAPDLWVLRAVGGTPGQSTVTAVVGAVLSALVAALVAVPVGLWLQAEFADAITSDVGIGPDAGPSPSWSVVGALIATLIALAIGVEAIADRWARHEWRLRR